MLNYSVAELRMDKNIQITENHYDSIAATSPYKTVLEFMETALEISSKGSRDRLEERL
mgnify:CR=1 FL=1